MNIIHEVLKMETQAVVCVGAGGTGAGEQYTRGFGEGDREAVVNPGAGGG